VREAATIRIFCLLWRNREHVPGFVRSLGASLRAASSEVPVHLVALVNGPDGEDAAELFRIEIAACFGVTPEARWCDEVFTGDGVTVNLEHAPDNSGYAGGMNQLLSRWPEGELFIFANLDVEFEVGFIGALQQRRELFGSEVLIVPSVSGPAGAEIGPLQWGPLLTMTALPPGEGDRATAATGSCMMATAPTVARRLAETGEMFWSELFYMSEDEDLFLWAEDVGVPLLFVPEAKLRHFHGGSFGGRYRLMERPTESILMALGNHRAVIARHRRHFRFALLRLFLWEVVTTGRLLAAKGATGPALQVRSLLRTQSLLSRSRAERAIRMTVGASA
jgi:GT2 family glycosyltransferase